MELLLCCLFRWLVGVVNLEGVGGGWRFSRVCSADVLLELGTFIVSFVMLLLVVVLVSMLLFVLVLMAVLVFSVISLVLVVYKNLCDEW